MKTFLFSSTVLAANSSFRLLQNTEKIFQVTRDCYMVFQDDTGKFHYDGPFMADEVDIRLSSLTTIRSNKFALCFAKSNPGHTTLYQTFKHLSSPPLPKKVLKTFVEPNFVSNGYQMQVQWENSHWNDTEAIVHLTDLLYKQKLGLDGQSGQRVSNGCYAVSEVDGFHFEGPMNAADAYAALGEYTADFNYNKARMVLCKSESNPDVNTMQQVIGTDMTYTSPQNVKEFFIDVHLVNNGALTQGEWGDFRRRWNDSYHIDAVAVTLYNALNSAWNFYSLNVSN